MTLLDASELAAIRALGEAGMITPGTIRRVVAYSHDDANPFGDDDVDRVPISQSVTVNGWLVSHMGRDFDEDGSRIVQVGDFTWRVPVGTRIGPRDTVTIAGEDYTVVETNTEDTYPEWTQVYLRRVS